MKRQWEIGDLIEHFTLLPDELALLGNKTGATRLGFAVLLKFIQMEGRFPRHKHEIPPAVVEHLARQVDVPADLFRHYDWSGRTGEYHRAQIRDALGFRKATSQDAQDLTQWLYQQVVPHDHHLEHLKAAVFQRCRELHIEPPTPLRIDRIIRSALRSYEEQFCRTISEALPHATRTALDDLIATIVASDNESADDVPDGTGYSVFQELKSDVGRASLKNLLNTIAKLQRLRQLHLPANLFQNISHKVIDQYQQRAAAEPPRELRRHPAATRYTLLAAFCWLRSQEITDTLVDLLMQIVHRIGVKAERKVDKALLADFKRVRGKTGLLFNLAEAALTHPDGSVRDVLYPVVSEQTFRDLVREYKAAGTAYEQKVQLVMRSSYSTHYRRMIPHLVTTLEFRSNNDLHRPVIQALALLKTYADSSQHFYGEDEDVPIEGVVPAVWRPLVLQRNKQGRQRVNRIAYEICVLKALREKLRCKEIWVTGANRFRNPDEDLPVDFEIRRPLYYAALHQPLAADMFISALQESMRSALEMLDAGLSKNRAINILDRGKGWIALSPLEAQPDPPHLALLRSELGRRWSMTSLLDMLKETDLRVGFTESFKSVASRETLDRTTLRKRILLCLYGLGTNTGIKRLSAGDHGETYADLLYVRRRFIHKDQLRNAIAQVVNAIFQIRLPHIWGEGTTACASDAKKFGAWDQNLMTEWHVRYRGPGIMIYWHVEKKSTCIYSQLKNCSSSEVAAMIEGLLRHDTEATIERNYVDTHGQSEIAFAFCHLLGFQLLPRLKGIHRQKLYRPDIGRPDAYPNLQLVLTRPIKWDLIRQQYDEMIKYATALRLGTAETEAILRRFTRNNLQHPTYQALAELGKVVKTIFLCQYLHSEALRREIHEGLNVIENWNSTNSFIFFGKGGEMASNRLDDQEVAMLSLHLLQICLVYVNTLMIQNVLASTHWMDRMTQADLRGLTPLLYAHVNPYGTFHLDLNTRLPLDFQEIAA